jgi:hypothetical protein
MKLSRVFAIFLALALMFAAFGPAYAQLGDKDISSFTIQNVDTTDAQVDVTFIDESGTQHHPTTLNSSQPNPFTLKPGESFEIYVPGIPADQLGSGRYSVMISSTAKVVAIANLIGEGSIYFNGSYSGFDAGASPFYLPSVVYNYYSWYSLMSVQNVGSSPADITVDITCEDGTTGQLTATGVAALASAHFDLKATTPTGFSGSTKCNGSAKITSTQPVVVVDNQRAAGGNTQSFSGVASGVGKLYIPALYHQYYGWDASLNIRKLGSGATTVTITYSDSGTSKCDLTDAVPNCLVYMPSAHAGTGYFGATITSSPASDLIAVVNAANGSQAQTYNAITGGTATVGIPSVMKAYYGWNTSFTCQNVGTVATKLHVAYDGFASNAYDTSTTLNPGKTLEIFQPSESFLPNGTQTGATITAVASGGEIACIVNFNNPAQMATTVGDWSMSYNAFNK